MAAAASGVSAFSVMRKKSSSGVRADARAMYRAVSTPLEGAAHDDDVLSGNDRAGQNVLGGDGIFKGGRIGRAARGDNDPPESGGFDAPGVGGAVQLHMNAQLGQPVLIESDQGVEFALGGTGSGQPQLAAQCAGALPEGDVIAALSQPEGAPRTRPGRRR